MGMVDIPFRALDDVPFERVPFTLGSNGTSLFIYPEGGVMRGGLAQKIHRYEALYTFELFGQEQVGRSKYFFVQLSGVVNLQIWGGNLTGEFSGGYGVAKEYKNASDLGSYFNGKIDVGWNPPNNSPTAITLTNPYSGGAYPQYFPISGLKYGELKFYDLGVPGMWT